MLFYIFAIELEFAPAHLYTSSNYIIERQFAKVYGAHSIILLFLFSWYHVGLCNFVRGASSPTIMLPWASMIQSYYYHKPLRAILFAKNKGTSFTLIEDTE